MMEKYKKLFLVKPSNKLVNTVRTFPRVLYHYTTQMFFSFQLISESFACLFLLAAEFKIEIAAHFMHISSPSRP
jgi:hypothetical protein